MSDKINGGASQGLMSHDPDIGEAVPVPEEPVAEEGAPDAPETPQTEESEDGAE